MFWIEYQDAGISIQSPPHSTRGSCSQAWRRWWGSLL